MPNKIFLYPSLTDDLKLDIFQAKNYSIYYVDNDGYEKELEYDFPSAGSTLNCLKTDGIWSVYENNLHIRRSIALKNFKKLFGPDGIACKNAVIGVSVIWTSPDSRQRGAESIMTVNISEEDFEEKEDHTYAEGELKLDFSVAKLRGDVNFSIVLYIATAGVPDENEIHLANEKGFILGELDSFDLRLEGTGSLFPVFEVYEANQPLWYVRCDWTDPLLESFSETVSININTAHKNYKYIDRRQKTFCPQLLVEVMSAALCCIIEKIRSEKYLEQIFTSEDLEHGSVGEAVCYFSNTLGWDFSTPENLSLSIRNFFDRRITE